MFLSAAFIILVRLEASAAGVSLNMSSSVDTDGNSFIKSDSNDISSGTENPSLPSNKISYSNLVEIHS